MARLLTITPLVGMSNGETLEYHNTKNLTKGVSITKQRLSASIALQKKNMVDGACGNCRCYGRGQIPVQICPYLFSVGFFGDYLSNEKQF